MMTSEIQQHRRNPCGDSTQAILACVQSLELDLAKTQEKFLRLAADFDNFKKRCAEESDRRAAAQKEGFMRELLPIIDNLERALVISPVQNCESLRAGVRLVDEQLLQLLLRHGIAADDLIGASFDPYRHEAIIARADPNQPDGVVLEVFERGYRRGRDVFRAARVAVNDLPRVAAAPQNTDNLSA